MNELNEKLRTETLYFWEDESQLMVMIHPAGPYYAKQIGGKEVEMPANSDVVIRAIYAEKMLTRAQYER